MTETAREELRRVAPGRPTALTVGVFDGVHLGHRHLLRHLTQRAHELGLAAGALTLHPDPAYVLHPNAQPRYLVSVERRLQLLREAGPDFVGCITFTPAVAELSAEEFAAILKEELSLSYLLMGPDHSFGRDRAGSPAYMAKVGESLGFEVEVLAERLWGSEEAVSSTAIRTALAQGNVELASKYLGRPFSLCGPVVKGDQRGWLLGFPTANIDVPVDQALPAFGIYATWAYLGEERHASATNIGVRPMFRSDRPMVETYIFDFDKDIYGQTLRIELIKRLRPEMSFPDVEALKKQMHLDVIAAREALSR